MVPSCLGMLTIMWGKACVQNSIPLGSASASMPCLKLWCTVSQKSEDESVKLFSQGTLLVEQSVCSLCIRVLATLAKSYY